MATTLKLGDSGIAVREMQGLLNSRLGKQVVVPDGRFGPKTESFIREFQKNAKLKADGIVGPRTWDALHAVSKAAICFVVDPVDLSLVQSFFARLGPIATATLGAATGGIGAPAGTSTVGSRAPAIARKTDF